MTHHTLLCHICVISVLSTFGNAGNSSGLVRLHGCCSQSDVCSVHQGKADDQFNWRVTQNEKLAKLREKLRCKKEQLVQGIFWVQCIRFGSIIFLSCETDGWLAGKAKVERLSNDLEAKYGELDSALAKVQPSFLILYFHSRIYFGSVLCHSQYQANCVSIAP